MKYHKHTAMTAALLSMVLAGTGISVAGNNTGSNQPVGDSYITTKVKAELAKDRATKAKDIKVTTTDGVVVLSGTVRSEAEKQKAEQDTRSIKGVTEVRNELSVGQH
ncbi:MAG: BON domain-containing protein [Steroidobacteraceae bacterium]